MKGIVALCLTVMLLYSCSYINRKLGLNDDNLFEEFIEKQVENKTGINVDLTPKTKEIYNEKYFFDFKYNNACKLWFSI